MHSHHHLLVPLQTAKAPRIMGSVLDHPDPQGVQYPGVALDVFPKTRIEEERDASKM